MTGRAWVYVRDDRPFGGRDPPAAVFFYSRDRSGDHPERHLAGYGGVLQADAYAGFNRLYEAGRTPVPVIEAACRVGEDVATLAPHRSGRAVFPHPVPHGGVSLAAA
jgi:transposase